MIDWSGFRPPADWRQSGGEWRGSCPVTGAGKTKAWAKPDEDLLGCRECAPGGLRGEEFKAHAAALGGQVGRGEAFPGARPVRQVKPAPVRKGGGSAVAAPLWSLAGEVPPIGRSYLAGRGAWSTFGALPPSVRWIASDAYNQVDRVWPWLPYGAAGALAYRFMAPDDGEVAALQVEALNAAGHRVLFHRHDSGRMKRPSLRGSDFGRGRRVFVGRWPAAPGEIWVIEGPLDALAVADYCRRHRPEAAVVGVPGTSGFKLAAVEAAPADALVVVAADADGPGRDAAVRLGRELERAGRRWEVRTAPAGGDWCDWAIESAERGAVHDA